MKKQYEKNIGSIINELGQEIISNKSVAVIGCGGDGGYIAEFLARLGIKKMSIWDGDKYDLSNNNRQIFCNIDTIDNFKVEVASSILKKINPELELFSYVHFFGDKDNDIELAANHDIVVLAADLSYDKMKLKESIDAIIKKGTPVIYEFCTPYGGYLSIVTAPYLDRFNKWFNWEENNSDGPCSQPAYLCSFMASVAVSEVVKYFTNQQQSMIGQLLYYDIALQQFHRDNLDGKNIY